VRSSRYIVCVISQHSDWSDANRNPKGQGPCLGKKVDADRGLVHVVERIVHEPCDKGRFANCGCAMFSDSIATSDSGGIGLSHTALFAEEDKSTILWSAPQLQPVANRLIPEAYLNFLSGLLYPLAPVCAITGLCVCER